MAGNHRRRQNSNPPFCTLRPSGESHKATEGHTRAPRALTSAGSRRVPRYLDVGPRMPIHFTHFTHFTTTHSHSHSHSHSLLTHSLFTHVAGESEASPVSS